MNGVIIPLEIALFVAFAAICFVAAWHIFARRAWLLPFGQHGLAVLNAPLSLVIEAIKSSLSARGTSYQEEHARLSGLWRLRGGNQVTIDIRSFPTWVRVRTKAFDQTTGLLDPTLRDLRQNLARHRMSSNLPLAATLLTTSLVLVLLVGAHVWLMVHTSHV